MTACKTKRQPTQTTIPTFTASSTHTPSPTAQPSETYTPVPTYTSSPTITPTPFYTPTPTPLPSQTDTPTASPTPEATIALTPVLQPVSNTVVLHPDGGLYVGDQVSIEVIPARQDAAHSASEQVQVTGPDGLQLGTVGFGPFGLGERQEAVLTWAWDTHGLKAGDYPLTFTIKPGGQTWTETVSLLPQAQLPWPEPQAHWATAHSKCCTIYYMTSTAAGRDIQDLLSQADIQASDAVQKMGIQFTAPITISLMSRVLGHGGFASQDIDISYLDRNYAGSDFGLVLHHEMIHILDGRLGGDFRPSLLVEGLAVYESGGHFKKEPLMPRAAALLPGEGRLGWYIPLAELADNFYRSQHEIGYLEGATLIEYMVDTWGWDAFSNFYRDIHAASDNRQATAIDSALQKHFQITFAELEAKYQDALAQVPVPPAIRDDMRLTVEYFDTARRYQLLLDPSAYFEVAWLVDANAMRTRGIVADYLRHPATPENQAIEAMLKDAFNDLFNGQYAAMDPKINGINAVLSAVQRGDPQPFQAYSRAVDYYAITQVLNKAGYEAQRIELNGTTAHAWVTAHSIQLIELVLERGEAGWTISPIAAAP